VEDWKNILCYDYDRIILNRVQILTDSVYLFNDYFLNTGVLQEADQLKEDQTYIRITNVYRDTGNSTFRYYLLVVNG
jgi:hypothetical protein